MAEMDEIPYRCPKCGDRKTFSKFSELRDHMHLDHRHDHNNRTKDGFFNSQAISAAPSMREIFGKEAKKLEQQLKQAKEIERKNKKAARKLNSARPFQDSLDIYPVKEMESYEMLDISPTARQRKDDIATPFYPSVSKQHSSPKGKSLAPSYADDIYSSPKSRSPLFFSPQDKKYNNVDSTSNLNKIGQVRDPTDAITLNSLQRELEIKEVKLLQAKAESQNLSDSLDLSQIYTDKLRKEQDLLVKQLKEKIQFKDAKLEVANEEIEKLSKERQKLQQETLEWSRENDAITQSVETLHEQLGDKNNEIERKENEIKKLKDYIEKASEKESAARQKLEEMIDNIIDRAESAENELSTIKGSPVYRSASMMEMRRPDQPIYSPVKRSTSALQSKPEHHVSFQSDGITNRYPSVMQVFPVSKTRSTPPHQSVHMPSKKPKKIQHPIHMAQLNTSTPLRNLPLEYLSGNHVSVLQGSDTYPASPPTHGSTDSGIGEGPGHGIYGNENPVHSEATNEDMLMDRDGIMWNGLYATTPTDGAVLAVPPGGHPLDYFPIDRSPSFSSQYASSSVVEPGSDPEPCTHQTMSLNQTWTKGYDHADTFFTDERDKLMRSLETQEKEMKKQMEMIKQHGKQLKEIRDHLNRSQSPNLLNRSESKSNNSDDEYEGKNDDVDDALFDVTVSEYDLELGCDSDLDNYIEDIEEFLPLNSPDKNALDKSPKAAGPGQVRSGNQKKDGLNESRELSTASTKPQVINTNQVQNGSSLLSSSDVARRRRDALFCVFMYLDTKTLTQISAVCTEWKQVGRHPALWKNLKFDNSRISSKFLQTISKWCRQINTLTFEGVRSRTRRKGEQKNDYMESVRGSLEAGIEYLLKASGHTILSLRISNCGNIITDKCLWLISCHCKKLERLAYLSSIVPAGPEVIWALGAGCKRINTLLLPPVYPSTLPHAFNNSCVEMIGKCWPHLRVLCIGGIDVNVEGLTAIASCCLRLQVLELDHMCQVMEDSAVAMCKTGLKGLQILEFTFTPVTPKALVQFNSACHHLRKISVHVGISDYYDDPKNKQNMVEYKQIIAKLKELRKRPAFQGVLHIKADYG